MRMYCVHPVGKFIKVILLLFLKRGNGSLSVPAKKYSIAIEFKYISNTYSESIR